MLGWMRKQTRSWFVYLAFGIIIVVFVFFYGWGGRGMKEDVVVATVNDQEITRRQYDRNYENLLMMSRNIYQRALTEKEVEELRKRALEDLIDRTLMLQEAERRGLGVSQDETRREIASTPSFQRGGVFDKDLYLRQLASIRMNPSEFEKSMKTNMLISKLMNVVQNTAKLSDQELFDLYRVENEKVSLEFLRLNALDFENKVPVSQEEAESHYEKAKEDFRVSERINVTYLSFDPKDYKEKAEIAPEEIEKLYRLNEDRFTRKKKVRARHILIGVDEKADAAAEEKAREKAEEVRKRIEKGEDFSKLAKAFSKDDATASKGGDLGYFEQGQMVKALEEAAFSLKAGELSPVVRTPRGFDIIRVEDVQEEETKPLEEVKGVIEEELKVEKSDELAMEDARRAIGQIYQSGKLVEYAEEKGFKVYETGFFSEGEPIKGVGINNDFSEAAFLLKEGEISPIVTVGKRYLVLKLVERQASYLPALEDVKEKVIKQVRREKAKVMAKEKAEKLLEELKAGTPMERIAKRETLTLEETGPFTRRSGFIGKIGSNKELIKEAFSLTTENPLPKKVYSQGNGFFLAQLKKREEAEKERFLSEQEKIRERLLVQKREERTRLWLKGLRERAETKILISI